MKAIRIDFNDSTISLNFDKALDGVFDCLMQDAVVNTATKLGSDAVFPTKGTEFFESAVGGGMFDRSSMAHEANYAAYTSKKFINNMQSHAQKERIGDFTLETLSMEGGSLIIKTRSKSTLGAESTLTWSI